MRKGQKMSEEQRMRNIERQKGLTFEVRYGKAKADKIKNNQRIAQLKRKARDGYINSPEARRKNSENRLGPKHPMFGKHQTLESNKKRSESEKGNKNPMFGKHQSLFQKTEQSKRMIGNTYCVGDKNPAKRPEVRAKIKKWRSTFVNPIKDTKIELKIQDYLRKLGIEFLTHQYINIKYAYQCDILIPVQQGINQKTIIECDGDYWHGNTKLFDFRKMPIWIKEKIARDFERTSQLKEQGYRVIRLWENEINKINLNEFKSRLS